MEQSCASPLLVLVPTAFVPSTEIVVADTNTFVVVERRQQLPVPDPSDQNNLQWLDLAQPQLAVVRQLVLTLGSLCPGQKPSKQMEQVLEQKMLLYMGPLNAQTVQVALALLMLVQLALMQLYFDHLQFRYFYSIVRL